MNTYGTEDPASWKVLGDGGGAENRPREIWSGYHKKKIKEVKYVWSRRTPDRHLACVVIDKFNIFANM